MEEKEYPIPDELAEIMDKKLANDRMRDLLIAMPFKFKKAKRCAELAVKYHRIFWREVAILYPELRGKNRLQYITNEQVVQKIKEE